MIDALTSRLSALPDVVPKASWGERAFFVNPGGALPSGSYFATIKEQDGENDAASCLGNGRWRLNFGPGAKAYEAQFGPRPARPSKGGIVATGHDFATKDQLMPHPVYGWMGWMAVVCPSEQTLVEIWPLIETAHARAQSSARAKLRKLAK